MTEYQAAIGLAQLNGLVRRLLSGTETLSTLKQDYQLFPGYFRAGYMIMLQELPFIYSRSGIKKICLKVCTGTDF